MPDSPQDLKVFVSSTSEDLLDYRAVARNVILDVKWRPTMMEHFGTLPDITVDAVHKEIEGCNLVLLIVAFRRGWVPTAAEGGNDADSITALELAFAREKKIPVLAMLAGDTWPGNLWEDDADARAWVRKFRAELNLPAVFFDPEPATTRESERLPAFRAKVREALLSHLARLLAQQTTDLPERAGLDVDYLATARDGLLDGTGVPFLGMGVYGRGPLSSAELASALGGDTPPDRTLTLATAAGHRERLENSRPKFLNLFQRVIEQRTNAEEPLPIYELMVQLEQVPLIVSTTYDQILESRFRAAGIPFVVVAHILRSADSQHDGKILVLRSDAPAEIVLADRVDLKDAKHVIYRPLGSPFLDDDLDPELEIDTVVVTETDHLTFLGRLENQHTRIPTAIVRLLRHRSFVFIGYGLDIWQYRLVMQVFQSVGNQGGSPILAVRTPETPMEEVAWKRLGADLIRMEAGEFARRAPVASKT